MLAVVGIVLSRAFARRRPRAPWWPRPACRTRSPAARCWSRPATSRLTRLGAPSLLLGSAALLVFSVLGYTGVAAVQRLFMAGARDRRSPACSAALLCLAGMAPAGAAAVTLTAVIGLLPGYPLLASWLGRLPVPELPDRPEEILEDRPVPQRSDVFAAVARSTELLSGMLLAAAVSGAVAIVVAGAARRHVCAGRAARPSRGRRAAAAGPAVRAAPAAGAAAGQRHRSAWPCWRCGFALEADAAGARLLILLVLVVAGRPWCSAAGLVYSRRSPSPYLGRAADILDVLAIMALIPLACAVAGLFGAIQGLFASIGG